MAGSLFAQYGVSPSQSGMFFEDMRSRSSLRSDALNQEQPQDGLYSYDDGTFLGADGSGSSLAEGVREIGAPLSNAGYTIYSKRNSGDYTHFASPYPSTSTFFAPTYTSDAFLGGRRNIKAGPVNLGFGVSTVLEYNDNVTRSSTDELDDIILGSYLNISANWPITESSSLTVNTALGFDYYFNHPEVTPYGNDFVLNVLPGSTIAFDGVIGPVYVVVYDRVSVRPATQDDFSINANDVFGVFQNDVGLGASWAINSALNFSLNYMHSTARVLNDTLETVNGLEYNGGIYDRDLDSVMAALAWSPAGTWTAGLEGNMSWVHYPTGYNNDGTTATAGAFFATPIGKSTMIRVAGGMQRMEFDSPPEFDRRAELQDILDRQKELEDAQLALEAQITGVSAGATQAEVDAANAAASRVKSINAQIASLTAQLETAQQAGDPALVNSLNSQIDSLTGQLSGIDSTVIPAAAEIQTAATTLVTTTQQKLIDDGIYTSSNRDTTDLNDYYFNLTIANRLTSRISQALTLGHESSLNTNTNFITADFVSYGISFIAWKGSRLSISTYYEDAEESGGLEEFEIRDNRIVSAVSTREDIEQYGVDVYWTHQLTSRMRLGLGCHVGNVDSSRFGGDYLETGYNIDINYALSRKMTLGLGYRYFSSDADDSDYDFVQNRAVLAFNYNF